MPLSVAILCRANICRSPMAEALWRHQCQNQRRVQQVESAGLEAPSGLPADAQCQALLEGRGLSLSAHRSARFNPAAASRHDLLLVMETWQAQRIRAAAPYLAGRVHLIGRWPGGEIVDPHGGTPEQYQNCLLELDLAIHTWLKRL